MGSYNNNETPARLSQQASDDDDDDFQLPVHAPARAQPAAPSYHPGFGHVGNQSDFFSPGFGHVGNQSDLFSSDYPLPPRSTAGPPPPPPLHQVAAAPSFTAAEVAACLGLPPAGNPAPRPSTIPPPAPTSGNAGQDGKVTCPECGKKLCDKGGLTRHVKSQHTRDLAHPCTVPGCPRGANNPLSDAAHYRKHMKAKHGITIAPSRTRRAPQPSFTVARQRVGPVLAGDGGAAFVAAPAPVAPWSGPAGGVFAAPVGGFSGAPAGPGAAVPVEQKEANENDDGEEDDDDDDDDDDEGLEHVALWPYEHVCRMQ